MRNAMDKDRGGVRLFRLPLSQTHRTRGEETSLREARFHLLTSITDTKPIRVHRERRLGDNAFGI
jgi:hypothetical protein